MSRLISALGIVVFICIAWLISSDRRRFPWRTVIAGVALQIAAALFILQAPFGKNLFEFLNSFVVTVLAHGRKGAELVFGPLAVPPGETGSGGEESMGYFLFFQGFPIIIFVASIMSMLYYVGIMPWIVEKFAHIFSRVMKISGVESLVSTNNIFVGIESVFAIRPFLKRLTRSEIHLLLTAGMATIASSVLAFYTQIMKNDIPQIAGHLISASLLSAPAAVIMAKTLYPEREKPVTLGKKVRLERHLYSGDGPPPSSVLDAGVQGSMEGVKLIIGITAMLIAFLGIVSLLNAGVAYLGGGLGIDGLSFEKIIGWILYPFAIISGIAPEDAGEISRLWGLRVLATEVPSYIQLASLAKEGMDPRSALIGAYGLCGFAHIAGVAIFAGGTAALVPERRKDLVHLGTRALLAANLACFQTAAVAGLCLSSSSTIIFNG